MIFASMKTAQPKIVKHNKEEIEKEKLKFITEEENVNVKQKFIIGGVHYCPFLLHKQYSLGLTI
jgi:hypothetical protein